MGTDHHGRLTRPGASAATEDGTLTPHRHTPPGGAAASWRGTAGLTATKIAAVGAWASAVHRLIGGPLDRMAGDVSLVGQSIGHDRVCLNRVLRGVPDSHAWLRHASCPESQRQHRPLLW